MSARQPAVIYQMKVTLEDTEPPIWRRFQVPENMTLRRLHHVLQAVMGWQTCHLHEFVIDGQSFLELDPDFDHGTERSDRRVRLWQVIRGAGQSFTYIYDFGDGWRHDVAVEKVMEAEAAPARCIAGEQACPPEDCGGVYGYAELVQALRKPRTKRHRELLEWVDEEYGGFDPEALDMDAINYKLSRMR